MASSVANSIEVSTPLRTASVMVLVMMTSGFGVVLDGGGAGWGGAGWGWCWMRLYWMRGAALLVPCSVVLASESLLGRRFRIGRDCPTGRSAVPMSTRVL